MLEHLPLGSRLELEFGARLESTLLHVAKYNADDVLITPQHAFTNHALSLGANWTVNLDAAIGFAATPAEIDLITVVSLFRGDADTFDLTHFTGGQMEVVLPMAEVTE